MIVRWTFNRDTLSYDLTRGWTGVFELDVVLDDKRSFHMVISRTTNAWSVKIDNPGGEPRTQAIANIDPWSDGAVISAISTPLRIMIG